MSRHPIYDSIRDKRRTWLVTGAAGFIGSHLVEALLKLDQTVVGLDNFSTGKRENVATVCKAVGPQRAARFRMIESDIRDFAACADACRGIDVVLHEAAIGSVPRSIEDPRATNATNVDGFLNMLVAARDAGVKRFVYAASSSTYGDGKRLPFVEAEIGKPLSPYALTKYVDELYAGVFARCFKVQSIGLRYFNVFGPRQDPEGAYAAVIPKWIAALLHGDEVWINGDGSTARDFCYIDNVVQANLLAATTEDPAAVNEVYNVAVGAQTTLDELFQLIRLLLASHDPAVLSRRPLYRDFRPGDMHISQADTGKAQALLRYDPAWDVREGMKWTVDAYIEALDAAGVLPPVERPRHVVTEVRP
jgi:UDP-N-acetylglucosamine 4-epimerase